MEPLVMTRPLAKFVVVEDSALRVQRIWTRVSERLHSARGEKTKRFWRRGAWALLAAAAVTGAVVFGPWSGGEPLPSAFERATLETAGDSLLVDLSDGSRIELSAATRVEVKEGKDKSVEVLLQRGRIECDVIKEPSRRFSVIASGIEVRVTGTRFSVDVSGSRVEVDVLRGSVELRRVGSDPGALDPVRRLGAGERWSTELAATSAEGEAREAAPALTRDAVLEPIATVDDESLPRKAEAGAEEDSSSEPAPTKLPSAKELLEEANTARRAGDTAAAVRAYERLLSAYPLDGRAGLSAFELGRLKMDRLGDLKGAVGALKRAVTLAPGAGFREDAMARLVEAYHAMGSRAACRRARSAYLESYPEGLHATAVAKRCEPK